MSAPINGVWYVMQEFRGSPELYRGTVWASEILQDDDIPVRVFFRTPEGIEAARKALEAAFAKPAMRGQLVAAALEALGLTVWEQGENIEHKEAA